MSDVAEIKEEDRGPSDPAVSGIGQSLLLAVDTQQTAVRQLSSSCHNMGTADLVSCLYQLARTATRVPAVAWAPGGHRLRTECMNSYLQRRGCTHLKYRCIAEALKCV